MGSSTGRPIPNPDAEAGAFDLRSYYENANGCNISMENGCFTHKGCVRGQRVVAIWRLIHAK